MNDIDKELTHKIIICTGVVVAFFISLWICWNFNIARKFLTGAFLLIALWDAFLILKDSPTEYVKVEISYEENLYDFFPDPFTHLKPRYYRPFVMMMPHKKSKSYRPIKYRSFIRKKGIHYPWLNR